MNTYMFYKNKYANICLIVFNARENVCVENGWMCLFQ